MKPFDLVTSKYWWLEKLPIVWGFYYKPCASRDTIDNKHVEIWVIVDFEMVTTDIYVIYMHYNDSGSL